MILDCKTIYWCTKPSMEAENYEDYTPCYPWPGKLTKLPQPDEVGELSYLNEEDTIDEDSNATAYVSEHDLFLTEAEAHQHYIVELEKYIQGLQYKINSFISILEKEKRELNKKESNP